jgi:hypothetical protein
MGNIYRRYYDLNTQPHADIYPESLKAVLPRPSSLTGEIEGKLLVYARLAIFEYGAESDCDVSAAEHYGNIPNVQHLIQAGEADEKGYRTSAVELWREWGKHSPNGKTLILSRVAYSYDAYAEIRGRTIPFFRDLDWQPRPLQAVIDELTDRGFRIKEDPSNEGMWASGRTLTIKVRPMEDTDAS